jgi:hypothetical protein
VQFDPNAFGPSPGTLLFEDNAGAGESNLSSTSLGSSFTQTLSLSGTGVSSVPPAVVTDNETITVTDAPKFADVVDDEPITVTDTVVVKAFDPTTIGLTALATNVAIGSGTTFTATVASTFAGTPTGKVTFLNGQTIISQIDLSGSSGVVTTPSITNFATGVNVITATYSGDLKFFGSTTATPVIVTVGAPDYTITANPTSLTLSAGGIGSTTITLTPNQFGFIPPIAIGLSCGNIPSYIHCTFTPPGLSTASVTLGQIPVPVTLAVKVDATIAAILEPHGPTTFGSIKLGPIALAMMAPLGLLGLLPFVSKNRKRLRLYLGIVALALTVASVITGCTSAGNPSNLPPAGAQTIVVNATSNGGVVHPLNLIINITN